MIEGTQECDLLAESLEEWSTFRSPGFPMWNQLRGWLTFTLPGAPQRQPSSLFLLTRRSKQDNFYNTRLSQR